MNSPVSDYKNYNILEDKNQTRQIKRLVPITTKEQEPMEDPIARQDNKLDDIFPTNN